MILEDQLFFSRFPDSFILFLGKSSIEIMLTINWFGFGLNLLKICRRLLRVSQQLSLCLEIVGSDSNYIYTCNIVCNRNVIEIIICVHGCSLKF
jgi:hypothetical protein